MSSYAGRTSLLPAACLWHGALTSSHLLSFTGPRERKEGATGKALLHAGFGHQVLAVSMN